jgi:hypothetical protein
MKAANNEKNIARPRFAACTTGARLLSIYPRAARRAPASESVSPVHLSAGSFSHDRYLSDSQNKTVLTRCEIFRGKVAPRQTQKPKHTSNPGRNCAKRIYE